MDPSPADELAIQMAFEEPLTEYEIRRIPMTAISQEQVDNGAQCGVCLTDYTLGERVAILGCKHVFHREHLEPWLRLHETCPACRRLITTLSWVHITDGSIDDTPPLQFHHVTTIGSEDSDDTIIEEEDTANGDHATGQ